MSNVRMLTIAASLLGLLAQPCRAAPIDTHQNPSTHQRGAFAGARLRIPFDGKDHGRPAATVSLTSVQRDRNTGVSLMSEGVQLGFRKRGLALSIAGQPIDVQPSGTAKAGISTLGWVGIGVGVLAAGFYGFAQWADSRSE